MKSISEKWDKGKLIERKEYDDGIPSNEELDTRLKALESKIPHT